ncbi:DNA adenine methylase [Azospirillum halopraeferens]|uniref:DNA adenine methylase n=1 Tax=Azospirillum halopraeferens TaxID=34010 RepID=UPI000412F052|nr:DNA adenine methylase [Azospirillum halopraeferens]
MRAPDAPAGLPARAAAYPELRYMGSKHRLLPWLHQVLSGLRFDTALDPFTGSGCVAYLMKTMGKRVVASDFLNVAATLAAAGVENAGRRLDGRAVRRLTAPARDADDFIERTFTGIFYTPDDLRFLDRVSANIAALAHPHEQALARAALVRSCLKKQPRGVFTVSGDLTRYDDGRRDLRLSMEEHFHEQVAVFNALVFDNGRDNESLHRDVFDPCTAGAGADLVYLDPPYVPRSDDNCYIKRYHFIEGLTCYWRGLRILETTKVRKIEKRFTPFSYRRTALDAFDRLFAQFRDSTLVLSYSSNGFPDRDRLVELMKRYKDRVTVHARAHRYHFGTHDAVRRAEVQEYLIVGQ